MIGSILSALEVFVLSTSLGAPLRRTPFPVHVAIKTLIYLVVILFSLGLGAAVFPAPGHHGIDRQDVQFSLAAAFVFSFIYDMNRLLGQHVLLTTNYGMITALEPRRPFLKGPGSAAR